MSNVIKRGDKYFVSAEGSIELTKTLPSGVYQVDCNQDEGFFLRKKPLVENPSKIYGDVLKNAGRILETYLRENKNMGVMLAGYKGSGKTLLAREVAIKGLAKDMPVILINQGFSGDAFLDLLNNINQQSVVLIDEYEKIYNKDNQNEHALLSLLDGISSSNKLFIMTCNEVRKVSPYMTNRPSRVRYMIDFTSIGYNVIKEVVGDKIDDKSRIDEVSNYLVTLPAMSFDKIISFVNEINYYNETCEEVMKLMNINSDEGHYIEKKYKVTIEKDGLDISSMSSETRESLSINMKNFNGWSIEFTPLCHKVNKDGIESLSKIEKELYLIDKYENGLFYDWSEFVFEESLIDPTSFTQEKFVFVDKKTGVSLIIQEAASVFEKTYQDYARAAL